MIKKLKLHRCCESCSKKKKVKLAEFAVALTESGELSNRLILLCQHHWYGWRRKVKRGGYVSYPFFYIKDGINKFNLRIESL